MFSMSFFFFSRVKTLFVNYQPVRNQSFRELLFFAKRSRKSYGTKNAICKLNCITVSTDRCVKALGRN